MEILDSRTQNWNGTIRRREFLAWVSAIVAAPSLADICTAAVPSTGTLSASSLDAQPLAVGYLEGSDTWSVSQIGSLMPGAIVVPAQSLAGGDVDFVLDHARLTVHGSYPHLPEADIFNRLDLSVFFPSPDPGQPEDLLRYFAWSYNEAPVLNLGAPNRFDVPVEADGCLALLLDTTLCGAGPIILSRRGFTTGAMLSTEPLVHSRVANFTVDGDPLRPKLRRGAYLLALSGDPWVDEIALPNADETIRPELWSLLLTVEDCVTEGPPDDDDGSGDGSDPPGDPDPTPGGECGALNSDLVLASEEVDSARTESACRSITATDYRVGETGAVTFDSPSIALGNGFEVGGSFEAVNRS